MDYDWETRRNIITTSRAKKSIEEYSEKYDRFDEQWQGLKHLLERNPEKGKAKKLESGSLVYVMHRHSGYPYTDLHEIFALYKYNEKEVTVYGVGIRST